MAAPGRLRSVAGMTTQRSRPTEPVIRVSDLSMRYGDRTAVAGLSFEVHSGELFALLGPNGAGKTTTVEILEGFRRRSGGTVSVLGADPWRAGRDWRARIGVLLQEVGPERELTVTECLRLYGGYYPDPWPAADLLRLTGLQAEAGRRAATLSAGQRRRLDLAIALVGRPGVLFLDEPTTGFDPAARREAWAGIAGLKEMGTTIMLTTHYMEEADRLADRIAVLRAGALVSVETPGNLTGGGASRIAFTLPSGLTVADLPGPIRLAVSTVEGSLVELVSRSPQRLLGSVVEWAERNGYELPDLELRRPTLEDAYLELTNQDGVA
jgi:ABC-2 type transport system ATP-binding protein